MQISKQEAVVAIIIIGLLFSLGVHQTFFSMTSRDAASPTVNNRADIPAEIDQGIPVAQGGVLVVVRQEGSSQKLFENSARAHIFYTGTLSDGTVFDTNTNGVEPFTFDRGAGQVIPGLERGLVGANEGETRVIFIPSDLAYGELERPGIPANSDLFFEVFILELE